NRQFSKSAWRQWLCILSKSTNLAITHNTDYSDTRGQAKGTDRWAQSEIGPEGHLKLADGNMSECPPAPFSRAQ
ncbi:MAG: hypothetical protein AAGA85_11200, partial [Bacteroidota bacterium]